MERIVDLHIHSHYSRATSKYMNIESLYRWGKIKGIDVIGTGDFTHPKWFGELYEKLEPAEEGLFTLKKEFAKKQDATLPEALAKRDIRFILTVEISNIYKRHERTRRLHNVVAMPSFSSAAKLNNMLSRVGNLKADGRPILGLDSEELLKMTLEASSSSLFIPAHIWTPWFSVFGSKSGFDSIEEAFGDNCKFIHAVETGLSSDPFMNRRLSELDGLTLVSHSDAHSPQKLGREANVISSKLSYFDIVGAIKSGDERFVGTIEFFPEEGKYHYDGHRACGVVMDPGEAIGHNNICPKCGQLLILGVEHRVSELADRGHDYKPNVYKSVEYIVPLSEIVAEVLGVSSPNSKKATELYERLVFELGDEFSVLRFVPLTQIEKVGGRKTSLAIEKMRKKDVYISPGYDGVYGTVQIFKPGEAPEAIPGQMGLWV